MPAARPFAPAAPRPRRAARRGGLARALTWAARGCTCAALAWRGASYDLYRKMGFAHVCNHRAYQPPAGP